MLPSPRERMSDRLTFTLHELLAELDAFADAALRSGTASLSTTSSSSPCCTTRCPPVRLRLPLPSHGPRVGQAPHRPHGTHRDDDGLPEDLERVGLPQRRHPVVAQRDAGVLRHPRARGHAARRGAPPQRRRPRALDRRHGVPRATDAESVAPRESEELVPAWRAPDEPPGASAFSHGYDDLAACSPFSVPGQRSRHLAQAEDPIDVDAEVTARA